MSASKCARCDKTVYPVEGLRCLDKIWHKGCFKCHECNMTLNMKNYKGFEKRPYCNAHCPQAKATTVADTPEIRRLAENTRIQSQAKYHEDFEKSKGKNFTTIADDPETRRVKETSKIISQASYHGDLDKKKHMEEKRNSNGGQEDHMQANRISNNNSSVTSNSNNNHAKHQNRLQSVDQLDMTPSHHAQQQQQQQQQQQHHYQQQQQQRLLQQQQQQHQQHILKRQHQYIQPTMNHHQQQMTSKNVQQHQAYTTNQQQMHLQQQQQQQLLMRQQQHQQQIIMQQHRQSLDASIPIARQVSKQAIITSADHPMMKHSSSVMRGQPPNQAQQQQQQQQLQYIPVNDAMGGQVLPHHLVGVPPHIINHIGPDGVISAQNRRPGSNSHPSGPGQQAILQAGYNPVAPINGAVVPKQQQHPAHMGNLQPAHHIIPSINNHRPDQLHHVAQQQRLQMRPTSIAGQPMHQIPHQVPRRVFRAMYDYVANDVDEVSFLENDILVDCVNVDRNWLIGKVARSGQTGMLPANYVELLPSQ